MPALDSNVSVHRLAMLDQRRHFSLELVVQVKTEVDKLINTSFIREVNYPTW